MHEILVFIWKILLKNRIYIIRWTGIIFLAAIVVSFIIPPVYTAETTLLPPEQSPSLLAMGLTGTSSGITGLSRLSGMLPGISSPSYLYAAILQSRTIREALVNRFDLLKRFSCRNSEDACRQLGKITGIHVTDEDIISIIVRHKDKNFAAQLANGYAEELEKFNTTKAITTYKRYRIYLEARLKDAGDSLYIAEEDMKKFQEHYRTVALDKEIVAEIEAIARLKGEIIFREVQKDINLQTSVAGNPLLQSQENELTAMKNILNQMETGSSANDAYHARELSIPMSRMPALALEYARLLRDVKIQETVYELLAQQYEQAKLLELKDTPSLQVLDRASPPTHRSSPRRFRFVLTITIIALLIAIAWFIIRESLLTVKARNHDLWMETYKNISGDLKNLAKWFHLRRK
jgi:uncharacterized protein involved in exopolysaccharide biosynthesis